VVPIGRDDAPVTVTVFFDYMCPFCGRFEAANSVDLDRLVKGGTVRVELRPMSFLDSRSKGSQYSTRAANALATVADGAPDRVWDFHRALFREQPEEGTAGLSDERIAEIARAAGVPAPVIRELPVRAFAGWVVQSTERAFGTGITGTPTVLVDQQKLVGDLYSAGALKDAVLHAARR
jgi:protein-disulfide isomerase